MNKDQDLAVFASNPFDWDLIISSNFMPAHLPIRQKLRRNVLFLWAEHRPAETSLYGACDCVSVCAAPSARRASLGFKFEAPLVCILLCLFK